MKTDRVVDGIALSYTRTRISGTTYTKVHALIAGEWLSLGDPWPLLTPSAKAIRAKIKRVMGIDEPLDSRKECAPPSKDDTEYRPIAKWPGYAVGTDGSVWSCRDNAGELCLEWHELAHLVKHGYHRVELNLPERAQKFFVHRLVLEAFVGPCPKGMITRHWPDRDRGNNRLTNLAWGTGKQNQEDRRLQGSHLCGSAVKNSKLTAAQVLDLRERFATGKYDKTTLGKMFGITRHAVYLIIKRVNWKWL